MEYGHWLPACSATARTRLTIIVRIGAQITAQHRGDCHHYVLTALTVAVSWLREEINWHVIVHDVYAYIAYGAMSE